MSGNGDMTIDEIMALGEKHTQAMKPKPKMIKKKKKKAMPKVSQKKPGLAEQYMSDYQATSKARQGGLGSMLEDARKKLSK